MRRSKSILWSASIARWGSGQYLVGLTMSKGDPSKTTHGLVESLTSLSSARTNRSRSLVKVFWRISERAPLRSTTTPRSWPWRM
jgi:hypothetical protein